MARKIEEIDVTALDEVASIAEEVERTGEPKLLKKSGRGIAIITPIAAPRRRRTGVLTESDPLFSLVGIGRSGVSGGYSGRKYDALREAHKKRAETSAFRAPFENAGHS